MAPPHLMSRIPRKLSAHALRLRVDSPHGFATSSTKKKESKWFMAEATSPNYWVVVVGYCWWFIRLSPVEVGSLSHYLQGFIHPRWLFGISEPSKVWRLLTSVISNVEEVVLAQLAVEIVLKGKSWCFSTAKDEIETDAKKQLMFIFHTFPKSIY